MTRSNYHRGSKRDMCYFCGAFGGLEEHHVIPQRFNGPDSEENVVEVCESCHKKLERLYDKSFYDFFGIDDEQGERRFQRTCIINDCQNTADARVMTERGIVRLVCADHVQDTDTIYEQNGEVSTAQHE